MRDALEYRSSNFLYSVHLGVQNITIIYFVCFLTPHSIQHTHIPTLTIDWEQPKLRHFVSELLALICKQSNTISLLALSTEYICMAQAIMWVAYT